MDIEPGFKFLHFVTEQMEEDLAKILSVHLSLWLIAVAWIALPPQAYPLAWMTGLAIVGQLAVGAKLQSIIIAVRGS